MLNDAFINALVASANQYHQRRLREAQRLGLIEPAARCAENHDFSRIIFANGFDRFEDRLRLENHSLSTAERPIVHSAMAIRRVIPQVMDSSIDEAFLAASPDHSELEGAAKEIRENRNDIESHYRFNSRSPSGKSTSIRRLSRSIFLRYDCAKGINVSFASPSTFRTWLPAESKTSVTMPRHSPLASNTRQPFNSNV